MARDGSPFACLACYDATTARWLERAGVHVLLAGDSAAQIMLGRESTIHMPLDFAVTLTAAVKRGAPSALAMADMPFMSYHADESEALHNAARFMTEGLADVVKIEADASFAPLAARMSRAGIPVCGHIGLRPQQVGRLGGYSAAGRTASDADRLIHAAKALEDAGCVLLLVEAAPPEVTERIIEATSTPVIGIGAGPACHGQILVLHDLVGMTDRQPGFVDPVAELGEAMRDAVAKWAQAVERRESTSHRYEMKPGESEKLSLRAAGGDQ